MPLRYEASGAGEPVVCIHGAFIADAFQPLRSEASLADRYRLITYHRRSYVGGDASTAPTTLAEQADDCRRLLSHLGVSRAHVVGHSFGGAVGLQLARDAPGLVHTLSLLEPALLIGENIPLYRSGLEQSLRRYQEAGATVAVDEFLESRWPDYRTKLDQVLPGAFEQALADAATCFASDLPAVLDSQFGEEQAREITQAALVALGERSVNLHPRFAETYRLLLGWLPKAEGYVLPNSTHFLPLENPGELADALAAFFERHPLVAD